MTDTHVQSTADAAPPPYVIPIKGGGTITLSVDELPDNSLREAIQLGLEALANKRMAKETKTKHPDPEKLKAACLAIAAENIEALKRGEVKVKRATKKGTSGAVMTEARRIAKNAIKAQIKANGFKVSSVPAKELTEMANELIAADPSFLEQARLSLEATEAKPIKMDLASRFKLSEADKAKKPTKGVVPAALAAGKAKKKAQQPQHAGKH